MSPQRLTLDFRFCTWVGHAKSLSCDEWVFTKWEWSRSREQFLHCGLRKFRHSKLSVYRWYTQLDRRRFVHDIYKTMKATRSRHGWVNMFITHCLQLNLQLHNFGLFRTCRTSSFCTVVWQLARFQLTRRIAPSLRDSWASCTVTLPYWHLCRHSAFVASANLRYINVVNNNNNNNNNNN